VGRRKRSEQKKILNTPFCEVRWCINIINLRLPGGGIFLPKILSLCMVKDRLQKRNEKSNDNLTQANLFRSIGNLVLVLR